MERDKWNNVSGTKGNGDSFSRLESCLEFRNADLKTFVRHLHERRCQKCWALFAAAGQAAPHRDVSKRGPKLNEAPAPESRSASAGLHDSNLDRWLIKEYALIPAMQRPMVGSNDWFRWLEEFQERHAADVEGLRQPLAERALQVLWNSR
jgi:hypothetical protein